MADTASGPGPITRVGAVDAPERLPGGDAAPVVIVPMFPASVVVTRSGRGSDSAVAFGTSRRDGETVVAGIRPGEMMFVGSPTGVDEAVAQAGAVDRPGTVDISHSRSVFAVSGPSATKALEKVCSLDWSDAMMPDGACGSASVAKISCDVIRADDGDSARYLLVCGRSLGQYFYESLIDSAAEFLS